MFKQEKQTNFKEAETIIGPSVKVQGDFAGRGNLIIEGIVNGSVKTDGNLKIGENSKIEASVEADNAIVSGVINGNVKIKNDLELTAKAKIFGDVEVKSICIARGAVLNGKCIMEEKKAEKYENKEEINQQEEQINEFKEKAV